MHGFHQLILFNIFLNGYVTFILSYFFGFHFLKQKLYFVQIY